MKVLELKKLLKDLDNNLEVVLSKDSEGNSYSPLAEVDGENTVYVPDSTWSGEIYPKAVDPVQGHTEEDIYHGDDGQDCVVLWPTN